MSKKVSDKFIYSKDDLLLMIEEITSKSKENFAKLTDSHVKNVLKNWCDVKYYMKRKCMLMIVATLKKACILNGFQTESRKKDNLLKLTCNNLSEQNNTNSTKKVKQKCFKSNFQIIVISLCLKPISPHCEESKHTKLGYMNEKILI